MKLKHNIRRAQIALRRPLKFKSLQVQRNHLIGEIYTLKSYDDHKCIYIHIPKCAGVSVNMSLFNNMGGGHQTIRDYEIIFSYQDFNNYFKFTFVRNPWDRILSAYYFLKKGGISLQDSIWAERNLSEVHSFEQFVMGWLNSERIFSRIHFYPQCHFLKSHDGDFPLDFIGKFENLPNDIGIISKKIHVDCKLEERNKSEIRNRKYRSEFTNEMNNKILELYHEDISRFEYTF